MAIRNNGNQNEHSIQALVEVALKVEIRKKEEEVIKRKVCKEESHGCDITVDLNIISLEIVIKGRNRQKLWKMSLNLKLKMGSVGLLF